ncbi:unnamed protein product [Dracunculus medinensis]|uniref:DUF4440 domain-containing protein n=1 Tax=Dracunculus medinensis TaxID=318479 RepID=A0A0N4UHG5_DRAME|nr:unnamed protein product [Dracunculus medinensis]
MPRELRDIQTLRDRLKRVDFRGTVDYNEANLVSTGTLIHHVTPLSIVCMSIPTRLFIAKFYHKERAPSRFRIKATWH